MLVWNFGVPDQFFIEELYSSHTMPILHNKTDYIYIYITMHCIHLTSRPANVYFASGKVLEMHVCDLFSLSNDTIEHYDWLFVLLIDRWKGKSTRLNDTDTMHFFAYFIFLSYIICLHQISFTQVANQVTTSFNSRYILVCTDIPFKKNVWPTMIVHLREFPWRNILILLWHNNDLY